MRRVIAVSLSLAVLPAACGSPSPARRAGQPIYCPSALRTGGPATKGSFDARVLLGMTERAASVTASRHGCETRVVRIDGQVRAGTADYRTDRLDLDLVSGAVVAVRVG